VLVWCVGVGVGRGAENWGGLIGLGSIGRIERFGELERIGVGDRKWN
jgi:hypothetical protein